MAQGVGHCVTKRKATASIPGQGPGLRCGIDPRLGCVQEATIYASLARQCFSPLSPSLPLSIKYMNKKRKVNGTNTATCCGSPGVTVASVLIACPLPPVLHSSCRWPALCRPRGLTPDDPPHFPQRKLNFKKQRRGRRERASCDEAQAFLTRDPTLAWQAHRLREFSFFWNTLAALIIKAWALIINYKPSTFLISRKMTLFIGCPLAFTLHL